MKREINCKICDDKSNLPSYPGEHWKTRMGKAKADFMCDTCGDDIIAGEVCVALSIWADIGVFSYHEWESEYLDL